MHIVLRGELAVQNHGVPWFQVRLVVDVQNKGYEERNNGTQDAIGNDGE
jgi:hypothetical protein